MHLRNPLDASRVRRGVTRNLIVQSSKLGWRISKSVKVITLLLFVFESNLVDVPIDSWWLNSGSKTHIAMSLQMSRNPRDLSLRERNLSVGNDLMVTVELVVDVSIVLDSVFELVLKDTFYVPYFRRNLFYVSLLEGLGFSFTFGSRKISMTLNFQIIGHGSLVDRFYKISLTSHNLASAFFVDNLVARKSNAEENVFYFIA